MSLEHVPQPHSGSAENNVRLRRFASDSKYPDILRPPSPVSLRTSFSSDRKQISGHTLGRTYIKVGFFLALGSALLFYGYLKSANLIEGPEVFLDSPRNGETTVTSLVTITGIARNIAFITLNDRQIFLDGEGRLNEKLLLSYGYNIITVKARDKFGKRIEKRIELVYN